MALLTRNEDFIEMYTRLITELRILKKEYRRMPDGKLMISVENEKVVYYRTFWIEKKQVKQRINHNPSLVYKLAHKAYIEERISRLEFNLAVLARADSRLVSIEPQDVFAALPRNYGTLDYRRVLDPAYNAAAITWPNPCTDYEVQPRSVCLHIDDMDCDEWATMAYCANTKDLHKKTHRSSRGILCRSKGEASLLDLLDAMKLRFHYDEVVIINGYRISPDIIIMREDGKLFFIEHRGWKGKEYDDHNMWKDNQYHSAGIVLGRNYIVTFDKPDGSADTELIRRQIENLMQL